MIRLFRKTYLERNQDINPPKIWPRVTTQIPVYNELNVVERVIRAAADMEYPNSLHEVQVLDDSNDETSRMIDELAKSLKDDGVNIQVIRRYDRTGFKAGALSNGMEKTKGEFFAIFDADFVPPADFLMKTIPHFSDESVGLVQARWGHLNSKQSLFTTAQSIGIDGHFMVEQCARNYNGLYMNFNGTAGVFRKKAIMEAGGWQWDTLTEDMDLSYRVQFAGWGTCYLPDLVVPAELPEDIRAFKSQQFRWAKGSIQTAKKLLPQIFSSPVSLFKKVEAFFHLTHYFVHPLMLTLSLLALPVIHLFEPALGSVFFTAIALILALSMSAPSTLYIYSQKYIYGDWKKRILRLPFLIIIGVGIAVSNTRAVCEALMGIRSDFIRTPKKGDTEKKQYKTGKTNFAYLEILLGLYCLVSFFYYLAAGKYLVGPFLFIYTAGFLFVGTRTLYQETRL